MPELPEVEVLVRHLSPLLKGKVITAIRVHRTKVLRPTTPPEFRLALRGARFTGLSRRGKYLVFALQPPGKRAPLKLLGHLGMTGRMYLAPANATRPKHAAVVLGLGRQSFIYEDTRYFGRLTLDTSALTKLGPEPLARGFAPAALSRALSRSTQAIKVKLLDQAVVAGLGNIYASEVLFRARVSPLLPARRLAAKQIHRLWRAIRQVLAEAIACGSTVPLNHAGRGKRDGRFYFGRDAGAPDFYTERLRVYDREGKPCCRCGASIKRVVQAARSTYFCPRCQRQRGSGMAKSGKANRVDARNGGL